MRTPLCIATLVALFSQIAPAQVSVPGSSFILGEGGPIPIESYGMTTVADLDGDGFEDMAVLVGDDLMLLFSPALYEVLVPGVLSDINDFVGVPAARPHGKDTIAVVGPLGAGLLGWNGVDFTHRIVGPGWVDALRVDTVPRTGTEPRQLVGVLADGVSVRRLTEDLRSPLEPWIDTAVCTLTSPILELALANLDGLAQPEIGLMTATSVDLRTWSGTGITTYGFFGQAVALNTIRATSTQEWLALLGVESAALGDPFISVLGPSGHLRTDNFSGDPMFVGMAASDMDPTGNGMDDLLLSYKTAHDVVYLQNSGDEVVGPIFDPNPMGAMRLVPMGPPGAAPDNETTPATTDFDNDGDDDILHPVQKDGTFFVFLSARVDEDSMKPGIDTRTPTRFVAGPTIQIETVLEADSTVITTAGTVPNVLEVFLYRRPDLASPMDVVPTFSARYAVADGIPGDRGELFFPITIPLTEVPVSGCTHFEAMYFLVARLAVEVNGGITERCPSRLIGIQGQPEGDNGEYLADHSSRPENRVIFLHSCPNGPGVGSTGSTGGGSSGGGRVGSGFQLITLHEEVGGSGDELDCLPKPTAGNDPPSLFGG